nr:U1 snRNP 70K protein (clone RNP H1) - human (fragments) [Homo sapiens]
GPTPCSSRYRRPRGWLSSGLVRSLSGRRNQTDVDAPGVEAEAGVVVAEGLPQPPRASGQTPERGGATRLGKMTQFLPPNLSERERRRDRDRDRDRDREHKRGERGSERGRDEARGGGGGQDNGLEGLGNDSRDMYMESEGGDGYLAPENGYLMEAA